MDFKHKQLSNGLTIIGEVNTAALSAAVGFFTRTGSRDESPEISGVSHFLEHMMFKGTESMTALEVNESFDRLGAEFNAFTSEENTVYYAAVLPEYLCDVTDLWAQLMRPSLRDDDFDLEKNVIKEEIAMYKDHPQFDVMDRARSLHFGDHPCGNSVLGTNETIDGLKSEQMREYFSRRYSPNNMVAACTGNFDFEEFSSLVEARCGGWERAEAERELSFSMGTKAKKRVEKDSLAREHICMLSPLVSAQDERRFAASLLGMILGDSTGSRYFWALVDTAIAEIAACQYDSMDGVGVLYSYLRCDRQRAEEAAGIVDEIFRSVKEDGILEAELQTARNKVLSAITIKSEQPKGRLGNLGLNWVYTGKYRSVSDDVASIKAVTLDDISELIGAYDPADHTVMSMGPA